MKKNIIKATPYGSVGIVWTVQNRSPRIVRIVLSKPGLPAEDRVLELYPSAGASSCAEISKVSGALKSFLEGEDVEFSLDVVDLALCGEFQRRVLRAEHGIPRGSVSTYRLIAARIGEGNAARAVGNALATNPFPLVVPCHRAVRSDRSLGGYQGGPGMKMALLEREGIPFDNVGRVRCEHFFYERSDSNERSQQTLAERL